ncbi:Scr1 family TA system antitoxin-like transcriptional regulator [Actinomadura vinacea]|uniref:Scr1 family TA system antitoxin-like transcriptional regulator n=1 Tax=Actinomadura vinacea TaxID=115336 RepID=UPI003CD09171
MTAQLRHLTQCSTKSAINIQVVPFRTGTPASTCGTFTIFETPAPFPEVAYTESMAGAIYVEPPETERFVRAYDGQEHGPRANRICRPDFSDSRGMAVSMSEAAEELSPQELARVS